MTKRLAVTLALALAVVVGSLAAADPIRIPSGGEPVEVSLFGATSLYLSLIHI